MANTQRALINCKNMSVLVHSLTYKQIMIIPKELISTRSKMCLTKKDNDLL